eukprot:scaffold25307_cov109-Isochrysis_galbana.AAC.16
MCHHWSCTRRFATTCGTCFGSGKAPPRTCRQAPRLGSRTIGGRPQRTDSRRTPERTIPERAFRPVIPVDRARRRIGLPADADAHLRLGRGRRQIGAWDGEEVQAAVLDIVDSYISADGIDRREHSRHVAVCEEDEAQRHARALVAGAQSGQRSAQLGVGGAEGKLDRLAGQAERQADILSAKAARGRDENLCDDHVRPVEEGVSRVGDRVCVHVRAIERGLRRVEDRPGREKWELRAAAGLQRHVPLDAAIGESACLDLGGRRRRRGVADDYARLGADVEVVHVDGRRVVEEAGLAHAVPATVARVEVDGPDEKRVLHAIAGAEGVEGGLQVDARVVPLVVIGHTLEGAGFEPALAGVELIQPDVCVELGPCQAARVPVVSQDLQVGLRTGRQAESTAHVREARHLVPRRDELVGLASLEELFILLGAESEAERDGAIQPHRVSAAVGLRIGDAHHLWPDAACALFSVAPVRLLPELVGRGGAFGPGLERVQIEHVVLGRARDRAAHAQQRLDCLHQLCVGRVGRDDGGDRERRPIQPQLEGCVGGAVEGQALGLGRVVLLQHHADALHIVGDHWVLARACVWIKLVQMDIVNPDPDLEKVHVRALVAKQFEPVPRAGAHLHLARDAVLLRRVSRLRVGPGVLVIRHLSQHLHPALRLTARPPQLGGVVAADEEGVLTVDGRRKVRDHAQGVVFADVEDGAEVAAQGLRVGGGGEGGVCRQAGRLGSIPVFLHEDPALRREPGGGDSGGAEADGALDGACPDLGHIGLLGAKAGAGDGEVGPTREGAGGGKNGRDVRQQLERVGIARRERDAPGARDDDCGTKVLVQGRGHQRVVPLARGSAAGKAIELAAKAVVGTAGVGWMGGRVVGAADGRGLGLASELGCAALSAALRSFGKSPAVRRGRSSATRKVGGWAGSFSRAESEHEQHAGCARLTCPRPHYGPRCASCSGSSVHLRRGVV